MTARDGFERSKLLDYHAARILLLISAFDMGSGGVIDGLTKLAKLDFLVRYPTFLERLSQGNSKRSLPREIQPTDSERGAVESRMIRYRYGPWDNRYYPIIGILIGLGLVRTASGRGRISLKVTDQGKRIADELAEDDAWKLVADRCRFVASTYNMTGNSLKQLIYDEFPEITALAHRELI